MSDEPTFFTDPGFGEFVVSANGHFDPEAGLWFKPWTNRPARADIGYIVVKHPGEEVVGYTYLLADPVNGTLTWYFGLFGNPELDTALDHIDYRKEFGGG